MSSRASIRSMSGLGRQGEEGRGGGGGERRGGGSASTRILLHTGVISNALCLLQTLRKVFILLHRYLFEVNEAMLLGKPLNFLPLHHTLLSQINLYRGRVHMHLSRKKH